MTDVTTVKFGQLEATLVDELEKGDSKELDFFHQKDATYELVVDRDRIKNDIDYRRDLRRFSDKFWDTILKNALKGSITELDPTPIRLTLDPAIVVGPRKKRPCTDAANFLSEIFEEIYDEPATLFTLRLPLVTGVAQKIDADLDDNEGNYFKVIGPETEGADSGRSILELRLDLADHLASRESAKGFNKAADSIERYCRSLVPDLDELPVYVRNFIGMLDLPQIDHEVELSHWTIDKIERFDPDHLFWEFTGIEDDINITFRLKVDGRKLKGDAAYRDKFIAFASQTITYFEEVSGRDGKVPDGMLRGHRDAYETESKRWDRPLSKLSMEDANFQRLLRALCAYASRVKATEMAEKEEGGQRFAIDPPPGTLWTSVNPRSVERSGMTRVVYEGPEVVHRVQGMDGRIHRLVVQSALPDAQKIVRNEYGNMLREAEKRGLKMAGLNPVTGRLMAWLGKEHTGGTTDVLFPFVRIKDRDLVDEVFSIHQSAIERSAGNIEDTEKTTFRLTGFHLKVKVYWNGRVKVEQTKRGDLKLETDDEHREALEEEMFRRGGFLEFIAEEVKKMRWPIMAFKESHTIEFEVPPLGSWQPKDAEEARSQAGPLARLCRAEEERKKWDDAATVKGIIIEAKESLRTAHDREASGDRDGAQELYRQVAERLQILLILNPYYLDAYKPLSEAVLKVGRPYSLEGNLCLSQIFEDRVGPARERVGQAIRHTTGQDLDLSRARRLLGEVREDLEPLVILYPSHSEAYSHYRFAQLTLENYDRLIEVTRFLLKQNTNAVYLLEGLADAFYSKGLSQADGKDDLRRARELYRTIVVMSPKNHLAYLMLGKVHEQLGENDLALEAYRKSLEGNTDQFHIDEARSAIERLTLKAGKHR